MGIISRCNDVVRSYVNSAISGLSSPEKMLRLLIQDMEDTLVKVRASTVQTIAERKDLEQRVRYLHDEIEGWGKKAEVAVINNRDDLAAAALQAKARHQQMLQTFERQLSSLTQALAQQHEDMERLQARLQDAKARQRSFGSLHKTAKSRLKLRRKLFDHRLSNALSKFEQLESNLHEIEGRVESYDMGQSRSTATVLGQLSIESSVNEELADMKMRLGNRIALSQAQT